MFLRQQKLDLTYIEDEFGDEPRIKTTYLENIKLFQVSDVTHQTHFQKKIQLQDDF